MTSGSRTAESDPRGFIEAPVMAALNGIVLRAVVGFAGVAGFASVPLIVHLDSPVHEAFHLGLPVAAFAFAAWVVVLNLLRPARAVPDPWREAAGVDSALTRQARAASTFMVLGWLGAVGAVLVHHHLGSPEQVMWTLLVDVPLTLSIWLAAALAWGSWCRRALARAEEDAAARLRRYWRHLAEPREAGGTS